MDAIERDARRLCESWFRRIEAVSSEQANIPFDEKWVTEQVNTHWQDRADTAADLHAAGYRLVPVEPTEAGLERVTRAMCAVEFDLSGISDDRWSQLARDWKAVDRLRAQARAAHRAVVEGDGVA